MVAKGKILLADDEEIFLEATGLLLEEEGYVCSRVNMADEITPLLGGNDFDLLITDLHMPGMQILEMVDQIQQHSMVLPVIVVTGYPSIPTAVESVRLKVLEYIIKPVSFPTLLEAVKRGIRQNQVLRTIRKAREESEKRTTQFIELEKMFCTFHDTDHHTDMETVIEGSLEADSKMQDLRQQMQDLSELVKHGGSDSQNLSIPYYQLREGLYETIQVLYHTKNAFKSKELAMLRQKLEELLKDTSSV